MGFITNIFAKSVAKSGSTKKKDINLPANRFYREDLGIEFKSSMEANYWRFLQQICKGIQFEYEPSVFYFPWEGNVQSKNHHQAFKTANPYHIKGYVPDFRISHSSVTWYVETKGKVDILSLEKARLLKVYFPWIKLYFVTYKQYNLIKNLYSHKIIGWE